MLRTVSRRLRATTARLSALEVPVTEGPRRRDAAATRQGLLVAEMLEHLLAPVGSERRDQVLTALLRTLGTDDEAAKIRRRLTAGYVDTLATLTDEPHAALRAELVLAWVFGISFMRGVAATPPLADADPELVRDLVLPAARVLLEKIASR